MRRRIVNQCMDKVEEIRSLLLHNITPNYSNEEIRRRLDFLQAAFEIERQLNQTHKNGRKKIE